MINQNSKDFLGKFNLRKIFGKRESKLVSLYDEVLDEVKGMAEDQGINMNVDYTEGMEKGMSLDDIPEESVPSSSYKI